MNQRVLVRTAPRNHDQKSRDRIAGVTAQSEETVNTGGGLMTSAGGPLIEGSRLIVGDQPMIRKINVEIGSRERGNHNYHSG